MVCGLALGLAAAGPLGVQLGLPPLAGLGLFALGGILGVFGAVWGLVTGVRHREDDPPRSRFAMASAGLALIPVILMVRGLWHSRGFEGLDDATTDVDQPVPFHHAPSLPANTGRDFIYDPARGRLVARRHPELRALLLPDGPEHIYKRALTLAQKMKTWEVVWSSPVSRTFEAIVTTRAFHFQDDVVVAVTPAPEGHSRVDVRSKSREPRGDFGINAQRVLQYLTLLRTGERPVIQ